MRYRTKLATSFSFLVLVSTLLALGISYVKSRRLLFDQIRSELLSIAVTSATSFNGDSLDKIQSKEASQTEAFHEIVEQLRFIRDSNRRSDIYIQYVYLIRKVDNKFIFLADAEENPKKASYYGEPFTPVQEFDEHVYQAFSLRNPMKDPWGVWFSSFAPIYNSQEKIVAYLCIDMSARAVKEQLNYLILYGAIGFILSFILAIITAEMLSKKMTHSIAMICDCVRKISEGQLSARVYLHTGDEIEVLANTIDEMAHGLEEKERLTANFGRYVSQHVLQTILQSSAPLKLEGEKRKVTILFSDIRQFTSISELLPAEDVVKFLNNYFENMIAIIFKYHGTLDKFIGDGIMAEFGVPLDDPKQEYNAVMAAIEMQHMVKEIASHWKGKGFDDIQIGIGIHTGHAVVGNIGSTQRMEYTAIGDSVNVASRLEGLTKELKKPVLISEDTYQAVKDNPEFTFDHLGEIQLRGRSSPIKAYSVITNSKEQVEHKT